MSRIGRIPFDESFWGEYLAGQEARLPVLPDVEKISGRVVRILGGNPGHMALQGTNTFLVGTGKQRILIDTGEGQPVWLSRIVDYLTAHDVEISHILLTHWHGDHTGGVPSLTEHNTTYSTRVYKNQPDRGQNPISDGQIFSVPGATLRAVHTPGHAVDHMVFVLEEENALFTGDNVLGHGYSVVMDLSTYMKTLEKMEALGCEKGYPAHGAVIEDLKAKMAEYIKHKEFRVQQVFTTLSKGKPDSQKENGQAKVRAKGGMTLAEIVKSIYGDVPPQMVEKALVPFLTQVLWKLAEDRKVGFEPGDLAKRKWFVSQPRARPGLGGIGRAQTA